MQNYKQILTQTNRADKPPYNAWPLLQAKRFESYVHRIIIKPTPQDGPMFHAAVARAEEHLLSA